MSVFRVRIVVLGSCRSGRGRGQEWFAACCCQPRERQALLAIEGVRPVEVDREAGAGHVAVRELDPRLGSRVGAVTDLWQDRPRPLSDRPVVMARGEELAHVLLEVDVGEGPHRKRPEDGEDEREGPNGHRPD